MSIEVHDELKPTIAVVIARIHEASILPIDASNVEYKEHEMSI